MKVSHLRRDPRASIVVCEQSPPYRGIEVRARARLETADAVTVGRRIAIRYLGEAGGAAQAERLADDVVIRLEPSGPCTPQRPWSSHGRVSGSPTGVSWNKSAAARSSLGVTAGSSSDGVAHSTSPT